MLANLNTTFGLGQKVWFFYFYFVVHFMEIYFTHLASPVRVNEINVLSGTFVFFHKMRRNREYFDQGLGAFREASELGHSNLFFFIFETFLTSLI